MRYCLTIALLCLIFILGAGTTAHNCEPPDPIEWRYAIDMCYLRKYPLYKKEKLRTLELKLEDERRRQQHHGTR